MELGIYERKPARREGGGRNNAQQVAGVLGRAEGGYEKRRCGEGRNAEREGHYR